MTRDGLTSGHSTGHHGSPQGISARAQIRLLEYPYVLLDQQGHLSTRERSNAVWHACIQTSIEGCRGCPQRQGKARTLDAEVVPVSTHH